MQKDTFAAALAAFDAAHQAVRAWPKDDESPGFAAVTAREDEALEALLRTPAKTLSEMRLKLRALRSAEGPATGDAAPESRAELAALLEDDVREILRPAPAPLPEPPAVVEGDFGAALATYLRARRTLEGAIGKLDGDAFNEVCSVEEAALMDLLFVPANSVADLRAKMQAVVRSDDKQSPRRDLAETVDSDLARLVGGLTGPMHGCAVEKLARDCARYARAVRRVDQCKPTDLPAETLPRELEDITFTAAYVRHFMRDRIESLTRRGGELVASSALGVAFQVLTLNYLVTSIVDQAELMISRAAGKGATPGDEFPFRDVEWRLREMLVNLVRAVGDVTDPDFAALEEELMPEHRSEILRIEEFAGIAVTAA